MARRRGRCSAAALWLLGFMLLRGAPSRAADTVAVGRPLSGRQTLVSKRGKFALGFFQPDNSRQNWYIGIWYNQISKHTPVWVANRNAPTSDPASSQLSISEDGNIVLVDKHDANKAPIWSTNLTNIASGSNTVGIILDTGNLVLADASNTSVVLWQSFDHFGDTWLPGGKLGRNNRTGEVTRLFAWKSFDDPATSVFSLELDPDGTSQYLLNWNGTREYWTSGTWNGHMFAAVPEMMASNASPMSLYTFDYVEGKEGSYFVYDVKDDDAAVVTRFVVDVTGQIKFLTWVESVGDWILFWSQPKAQCDVYALCGAFSACTEKSLPSCSCLRGFRERRLSAWMQGDHTAGCARDAELRQQRGGGVVHGAMPKGNNDGFYAMPGVKLPSDGQGVAAAASGGECEAACLAKCACTAYAYNGSCWLWHGGLINLQVQDTGSGGGTIMIRLAASEFSTTGHAKKLTIILVVVAAVVAVFSVLVLALILRSRNRSRVRAARRVEGSLMAFTYRDMQSVTSNFSEKLGGGAFGSVFKGSLPDATATPVAVKKLEGVRQGEKQFRAEVSTIGTIQHVNLIRLLGFCSDRAHRLLVYLAPEWITGAAVTAKADVFSYGMVLFEIVSGRRNVEQREDGGAVDFFPSMAVSRLHGGGEMKSVVDGRLGGEVDVDQVERACKVACWCVQDDEGARPSMGMVVQVLEGLVDVSVPPISRSLRVLGDPPSYVKFFSGLPSI